MSTHDESRRKFVKTVAYIAPAILTLKAAPAFAGIGSGNSGGPKNRGHLRRKRRWLRRQSED
jgi:hypothetical protein